MSNIPGDCVMITFQPLGLKPAPYYIWERAGKWYWHALGRDGQARTRDEACRDAKNWISGQSPKLDKD